MPRTYTIIVRLTVNEHADEHLQSVQAIKGEVESWLMDLGAQVQVTVREDEP